MIKTILFACTIFLCLASEYSNAQTKPMETKQPAIKFGEKVTLTGVYTPSIIAKRKGNGKHMGHYKIVVNDALEVILLSPYQKGALRSQDEVRLFEGKKVTVTGIIREDTLFSEPSLENEPLSVNIPSFVSIEDIRLAED